MGECLYLYICMYIHLCVCACVLLFCLNVLHVDFYTTFLPAWLPTCQQPSGAFVARLVIFMISMNSTLIHSFDYAPLNFLGDNWNYTSNRSQQSLRNAKWTGGKTLRRLDTLGGLHFGFVIFLTLWRFASLRFAFRHFQFTFYCLTHLLSTHFYLIELHPQRRGRLLLLKVAWLCVQWTQFSNDGNGCLSAKSSFAIVAG